MNWNDHVRWATKLGIPEPVAEFVNRVIDVRTDEDIPRAYRRDIKRIAKSYAEAKGAGRAKSALGLVIATRAMADHDAGRRLTTGSRLCADVHRRALGERGDDYVLAWYLHHHLDYLWERRTSDTGFRSLLENYRSRYPQAYSPEVETFLLANREALIEELGLTGGRSLG